jgi:hypothetical protein
LNNLKRTRLSGRRMNWPPYTTSHVIKLSLPGGHEEMSSILSDQFRPRIRVQMRGDGGCGVSANEYSYAQGALTNFGDLTPCLTSVSLFLSIAYRQSSLLIVEGGREGRSQPSINHTILSVGLDFC